MHRICHRFLAAFCALMLAGTAFAQSPQRLVYNLDAEPKTLDPALATGIPEAHVILNLIEGLTRTDEKGAAVPAIAQRWEISADARTYTFHLRDAVWSNGDPVTAADFVFGWRRCLRPETAAEYAYQLFFVEGAEDYNAGRTKDPSTVAVRALTSHTLEVRLRAPTPFFPSALAHYAYSPLNESWVTAHPSFASDPKTLLCNGPFILSEWRRGDRLILKRNPRYHNAAAVALDTLEMTSIRNESTALMQWESGALDVTGSVPLPDIPRLQREGKYRTGPYLGVYFVGFQNARKPFDDPRVRRAFSLAINREQITRALLRGGQPAALAFVPPGVPSPAGDFRTQSGNLFREDVAEARRLLAEAGYPGGRGLPRIRYLTNDLQLHRNVGEALQAMWRENLGARVELDVQEWKVYLQNRQQKNFQMTRSGWIGDYFDALTFLDVFTSASGNNNYAYRNTEFERLLASARVEPDARKRDEELRRAEGILIGQDMAVAPVYFYLFQYLEKPRVSGIVRNALGYIYFDRASVGAKP